MSCKTVLKDSIQAAGKMTEKHTASALSGWWTNKTRRNYTLSVVHERGSLYL